MIAMVVIGLLMIVELWIIGNNLIDIERELTEIRDKLKGKD